MASSACEFDHAIIVRRGPETSKDIALPTKRTSGIATFVVFACGIVARLVCGQGRRRPGLGALGSRAQFEAVGDARRGELSHAADMTSARRVERLNGWSSS